MKTLRDYQDACLTSLWNYLFDEKNKGKNPLVVVPVAGGKTLLMAEFMRQVHERYARTRILVLTHVKELLQQGAEELYSQYPLSDFGFYCASLGEKKLYNDITFASIQSVHNKINRFNRCPDIILIDECHLISHKDQTTYRKFIDSVLAINPNCKIIGFTGTPFRSDTGRLDEGEGRLFDDVAYEIPMSYMIEQGYWTKPFTPKADYLMDVTGIGTRNGEYIESQVQKAIDKDDITKTCVDGIIKHAVNRKKCLIFAAGVDHANHIRDELLARGETAVALSGETDNRDKILKDFEAGVYKYLINIAVLTTGYDCPLIDMIVFMRPLKSPVLYIQCVGRGVRTVYADGYDLSTKQGRLDAIANGIKPDCMVLDFGGVVDALGCIDQVEIRKVYKGESENDVKGDAITKTCPSCGATCNAGQKYCYECSYSFLDASLENSASKKAVVSVDIEPELYRVMGVNYVKHNKKVKKEDREKEGFIEPKPTMRVEYVTMDGVFKEWVCFEHTGFALGKAKEWHKKRDEFSDMPETVDDAIEFGYPEPEFVIVKKEGQFDKIIGVEFDFINGESEIVDSNEAELIEEEYEIPF